VWLKFLNTGRLVTGHHFGPAKSSSLLRVCTVCWALNETAVLDDFRLCETYFLKHILWPQTNNHQWRYSLPYNLLYAPLFAISYGVAASTTSGSSTCNSQLPLPLWKTYSARQYHVKFFQSTISPMATRPTALRGKPDNKRTNTPLRRSPVRRYLEEAALLFKS
jgi:hypothetical protein